MKRGFTLVELLCVIVIISVVTMITVPIINTQIVASRNALYESQIDDIESAAKKWATENNDLLDKNHINSVYVSLDVVQKLGYLEKDQIINPKTKEDMKGCVLISYNNSSNGYNYIYEESSCVDYADNNSKKETDPINAYVIYDAVENEKSVKNKTNSKEKVSAATYIINFHQNHPTAGNILRVEGETISGLYDLEDEYVFRGSDVNNYATYKGKTWRILSINKDTNSIKLISTSGAASSWGEDAEFYLDEYYIEDSKKYSDYKIDLKSGWNVGIVTNNDKGRNIVKQEVKKVDINESTLYFGLVSVYDYINASTTCSTNFKSSECANNNYLKNIFNGNYVWTINRADDNNLWTINNSGVIELKNKEGLTYHKYNVILLNSSVYINDNKSAGTSAAPFILE